MYDTKIEYYKSTVFLFLVIIYRKQTAIFHDIFYSRRNFAQFVIESDAKIKCKMKILAILFLYELGHVIYLFK